MDPSSFFGSSKIKQSDKTQVKQVAQFPCVASAIMTYSSPSNGTIIKIKKPKRNIVMEDDDDMDFGVDDDVLLQLAESSEAILSSAASASTVNKGNHQSYEDFAYV